MHIYLASRAFLPSHLQTFYLILILLTVAVPRIEPLFTNLKVFNIQKDVSSLESNTRSVMHYFIKPVQVPELLKKMLKFYRPASTAISTEFRERDIRY